MGTGRRRRSPLIVSTLILALFWVSGKKALEPNFFVDH
jgi:hypothetical protein